MSTRFRSLSGVALFVALLLVLVLPQMAAAANTIVTPANPDGWAPTDVRSDATVGITADNPRSGLGSLKFTTNTVTSGQDKADFTKMWVSPPVTTRTLASLSDVSYEFYRDASSTTAAHFAPALRLLFSNDNNTPGNSADDHVGTLVWEAIYNGINPVPTNAWQSENLFTDYFWMRYVSGPNNVGGCERTIQNFSVTLNQWLTANPQGQPGDCVAPNLGSGTTYIYGVNTGVGSGWGATFLGYVDNVVVAFGADVVSANFEPNPLCTTICYVDDAAGSDANGGTSAADAFKTIQKGINTVQPGGEVRVLQGTYPESPNINKSLTLVSVSGRNVTTIDLQSGPTYLGALTIDGAVVTVDGFTIEGFDAVGAGLASSNVLITNNPDDVVLQNNRFKVGQVGGGSNGDDGLGILTTYNTTIDVASLVVADNLFVPVGASALRAFYVNPGVDRFEFTGNNISGAFTASSYTQAKDGLVEDNTIAGTGTSRGLGTWGYPDPTVYGATVFRDNSISDVVNGITILGSENVTVTKNVFTGNDRAVYVAEDDTYDLSTLHINRNSIDGNDMGVENWYTTTIDATCNWWGDASGPGPVGPGTGDNVSANVDFDPWLHTSNLNGACFGGPAAGDIYVSTVKAGVTDDALAYGPHDILLWDGSAWSKWFDGSAAGLMPSGRAMHNINSVWIPDTSGDDVVLSFVQNGRVVDALPGKINGMDLVWWNGSSFSLWFDGEDVGLTNKTKEKIDALHVLDGSMAPPALAAAAGGSCLDYLLISTQGDGQVPNYSGGNIKFDGTDVLGFCMTQSGNTTMGKWIRVLNGKAEGMPGQALTSLSASDDGQTLYLTTKKTFNVDSASGSHSMVYVYDFSTGEFSGPIFSAPDAGLNGQVDALHVDSVPN